ncbi:hypothetical protein CR513_43436, partial [Mucuna pruriens]
MLDLGASINVMPTSIYKSLKFSALEPIGMTIQLENRSVVQPLGILEDELVTEQEIYGNQANNDSVGLDLDLASLNINKACQATSFGWRNSGILDLAPSPLQTFQASRVVHEALDQDLGRWKLSKVIDWYSRCIMVDRNLNVWPSLVHHCCPSKSPRPSQSDSVASESALYRDQFGLIFAESESAFYT